MLQTTQPDPTPPMVRVFVEGGQYASIFGADNALDAVAGALRNPVIRSRTVLAVTFDEDPIETAVRLGLRRTLPRCGARENEGG